MREVHTLLPVKRHRKFIIIALTVTLVASVGIVWRLSVLPPTWYEPIDMHNPIVVELADRTEYRVIQEAQTIRNATNDTWSLRLNEHQINAWLASRLRKWVEREEGVHWPLELGSPQVRVEPTGVRIAVPVHHGDSSRFAVVTVEPVVASTGIHLRLKKVALGRMAIPGEPLAALANYLHRHVPEAQSLAAVRTMLEVFDENSTIPAVIPLADDRSVEINAIQLGLGEIHLQCRTLP